MTDYDVAEWNSVVGEQLDDLSFHASFTMTKSLNQKPINDCNDQQQQASDWPY